MFILIFNSFGDLKYMSKSFIKKARCLTHFNSLDNYNYYTYRCDSVYTEFSETFCEVTVKLQP